jgi:CRP-like cAMP-binding protein
MTKGQLEREIYEFLEAQMDFANLPSSEINRLSKIMRKKKIRKGQWIFDQEDEFEYAFFVKKGHVKLFSMNPDGDTTSVAFLVPQAMFPLRGVLQGQKYCYNAVAMCNSEIYLLPIEELRKIIVHHYAFTMSFMKRMEQLIDRSEKLLERTTCSNATQRVRQVLDCLNEDYAQRCGNIKKVPFKIFLKDLAVLSATTSETAGTVIKEMKDEKKVLYNKKIISFI